MKFGLTPQEYDFIERTVVAPLASENAQVWCFGSRARGDHEKFSDLDLLVESTNDVSRLLSEIRETLQESNFPYKVDLVRSQELAESYREGIMQDKALF